MGDQNSFLDAIMQGQQFRTRKRVEAEAEEDRSVLKELLQHELRTIKLKEKMQRRQSALEGLKMASGQRQNEVPDSMLESLTEQQLQGDQSPGMIATMPQTITPAQRRMKPMDIPGIEEWGIPGQQQRPLTAEQMLRDAYDMKLAESSGEAYTLGRGASRMVGNQVVAHNPYTSAPPAPHWEVVTDKDGNQKAVAVPNVPGGTIDKGKPYDPTLVHTQEQAEPGGPITHRFDPRSQVAGRTTKTFPAPSGSTDELYVFAQEAEDQLNDLAESIKGGAGPASTEKVGGGWFGYGAEVPPPNDKNIEFSGKLDGVRNILQAYYAKSGMGVEAAEAATMRALGITRDEDENETLSITPEELRARIPSILKSLRQSPSRGAGAAAPTGTPTNTGGGTAKDVQGMQGVPGIEIPPNMRQLPDGRIIWGPGQ